MPSPETKKYLVEAARRAQSLSYAPYSNYQVGAALLTAGGEIFSGTNVENAVFSLTICAERSAVASAVSQGHLAFEAIAVVTKDGGTPCGSCRQVLTEFGPDILVILADEQGRILDEVPTKKLLPNSFGSENLKNGGA